MKTPSLTSLSFLALFALDFSKYSDEANGEKHNQIAGV